MSYSEKLWHPSYWFGSVDPRPLAIFRIAFGVTLLHDLYNLLHDFRAFLTDGGMLPRGVEPVAWGWSVFSFVGSPFAVGVVYALGVLAVIAFTAGFYTRIATVLCWIFLTSLHTRNLYITDAGDDLARILMFWCIFAELGACWSMDARRTGRAPAPVPAIPLRVMQWHIIVLYAMTGILKLRLGWTHGTAIFMAMQLEGFVRPAGALLAQYPALCRLSTYGVMAMELSFAPLAMSPFFVKYTRAGAIACGLGVQLGILTFLRVGIFTELMICVMVLFTLPEWIDRAEAWVRNRYGRARATFTAASLAGFEEKIGGLRIAFVLFLGAQFSISVWDYFLRTHIPLPRVIIAERALLALNQPMDLFGQIYEVPHWSGPGVLEDGSAVDILPVVAPGTCDKPTLSYNRWNKFTYKWKERPIHYPELGAYFCRAYNEHDGPKLRSFKLVNDYRAPQLPGGPLPPAVHQELLSQECSGS